MTDPYHKWVIEELVKRLEKAHEDKQFLIDVLFESVMAARSDKWFQGKSNEVIAEWVRSQIECAGLKTKPIGCKWGVLENE